MINYQTMSKEQLIEIIVRRDKQIAQLKHLQDASMKDEMTGAYNKASGMSLLNKKMTSHDKVIVCFVDMNNLKKVNDLHGHVEGDNAIKLLVDCIKKFLDKDDFVARIGGDEFLVVFPNDTMESAKKKISSSRKALVSAKKNHDVPINFSAGFIDCKKHVGMTIKQMVDKVDKTMYRNKVNMKAKSGEGNWR